MVISYLL